MIGYKGKTIVPTDAALREIEGFARTSQLGAIPSSIGVTCLIPMGFSDTGITWSALPLYTKESPVL